MGCQRRRRGFAVGAGNGDKRRGGRLLPAFAREKLHVAHDFNTCRARQLYRPVGLGMRQGHAGREHEGGYPGPIGFAKIAGRNTLRRRARHAFGIVVPCQYLRAARDQRVRSGHAGTAQPEKGNLSAGKGRCRDHLSFSVERPIRASITAMIQKRMTTWLSVQPSFSKWWWIGAMRKTRLPVVLKWTPWMMTERISTTTSPPMMARTISCLLATATAPIRPPSASEPDSAMKIAAGSTWE